MYYYIIYNYYNIYYIYIIELYIIYNLLYFIYNYIEFFVSEFPLIFSIRIVFYLFTYIFIFSVISKDVPGHFIQSLNSKDIKKPI